MIDLFSFLSGKKQENKKEEPFAVTAETVIGDLLDKDDGVTPYFLEIGMHCLGCPASRGETIEEACAVHDVDCEELLFKLNTYFASKRG